MIHYHSASKVRCEVVSQKRGMAGLVNTGKGYLSTVGFYERGLALAEHYGYTAVEVTGAVGITRLCVRLLKGVGNISFKCWLIPPEYCWHFLDRSSRART